MRNLSGVELYTEIPIPVREHLRLAQERPKLNYLFWSASPKECLENVKAMLTEPNLAGDPAGGLDPHCPTQAFLSARISSKEHL